MHRGYIKLWRKIDENPIATRPAYLSVFLWLSRNANGKPKRMIWNNKDVTIGRGQLIISAEKIAFGTGVPRATVKRILEYLKMSQMVSLEANKKFTLITVLNYDKYQPSEPNYEPVNEPQVSHRRATSEPQVATNKNDKKEKNEKNFTNVKRAKPSKAKKSKSKKRGAAPKRLELMPDEPQNMNESIDRSFPRKRIYGDERINWILDYVEHKLTRSLGGKELWNRRYAKHALTKVGAGKLRDIIDMIGDPGNWWHTRISQMDGLYRNLATLEAQLAEEENRRKYQELATKNFE